MNRRRKRHSSVGKALCGTHGSGDADKGSSVSLFLLQGNLPDHFFRSRLDLQPGFLPNLEIFSQHKIGRGEGSADTLIFRADAKLPATPVNKITIGKVHTCVLNTARQVTNRPWLVFAL